MDPETKLMGRCNWYANVTILYLTITENLLELAIFSAYFGVGKESIQ